MAAAGPLPSGRWLVQDKDAVIEIAPCAADPASGGCGRIVGMLEPQDENGRPAVDWMGRPQCGATILHVNLADDAWIGRIVNPEDGKDWRIRLRTEADGSLMIRGYVLLPLLGASQTWTRYGGAIGPGCAMR